MFKKQYLTEQMSCTKKNYGDKWVLTKSEIEKICNLDGTDEYKFYIGKILNINQKVFFLSRQQDGNTMIAWKDFTFNVLNVLIYFSEELNLRTIRNNSII